MKLFILTILLLVNSAWADFLPKSFVAQIEQQQTSIVTKRLSKTPITMKYLFPNNLYFDLSKGKSPVVYVCNKSKTWMYSPPFISGEKGECKVGESSKYCYVKIFDALNHGLISNKLYSVKNKANKSTLSFSAEARRQLGIKNVVLNFKNKPTKKSTIKDVASMVMYKVSTTRPVTFVFKSLTKKSLRANDFVFDIPKNTNITHF